MKATLLTYNLPEDHLRHLRFLCLRMGIVLRPVPPAEWGLPLSVLAGLTEAEGERPVPEGTVPGTMLVMCGFSGTMVNGLLSAMRQARLPAVALKAILTPSNAAWSSTFLHAQLLEEHQALQQGRTPAHEQQ